MKEKLTENLTQIQLDDLISESVENARSRRQKTMELEDDLRELSVQEVRHIKGGLSRDIITMGYFAR